MATSANRPRRLYLDSDDRVSGTHNDFEIELPAAVVGATGGEPVSATIPLACYPVPSYERYLWWTSWDPMIGGATLRTTVNVDQNFTTVQQLLDAVNFAVINNTIRTDNGTTISGGLTFTYNSTTSKVEFSSVGNITLYGYKASPECYHNLTYRLGFTNPLSTGVYSSPAGYIAANPGEYAFPSILRTSCIYIACSLCQGDSMTTSEAGSRDLLVKVPVTTKDSGLGAIVQYQNDMLDRTVSSMPHTFKRIRVRLLDEEKQPLELSNNGKGTIQVELRLFYD